MKKINYIINYILLIIAILNIIFSFSLLLKEGRLIFVNSKNIEIVKEALDEKIENTDDITKIILGREWNSGVLTIYHSLGKSDKIYIVEGYGYEKLVKYIKQNAINLNKVAFWILISSVIIISYVTTFMAIKIIKKNR